MSPRSIQVAYVISLAVLAGALVVGVFWNGGR